MGPIKEEIVVLLCSGETKLLPHEASFSRIKCPSGAIKFAKVGLTKQILPSSNFLFCFEPGQNKQSLQNSCLNQWMAGICPCCVDFKSVKEISCTVLVLSSELAGRLFASQALHSEGLSCFSDKVLIAWCPGDTFVAILCYELWTLIIVFASLGFGSSKLMGSYACTVLARKVAFLPWYVCAVCYIPYPYCKQHIIRKWIGGVTG